MASATRSISDSSPSPSDRSDLLARLVRHAATLAVAVAGSAWTVAQKTGGYDRAAAQTAEQARRLNDHEQKLALIQNDLNYLKTEQGQIRDDVHEIRYVLLRNNQGAGK